MPEAIPTIIVIDDDLPREIGGLLRSVELQPKLFASVDEFLKAGCPDGPTCLVLDVRLPGEAASTFDESSADPFRGQDALPRGMNRLGSPELVLNPWQRGQRHQLGDGAPMCSGATTVGSAVGARAPSKQPRRMGLYAFFGDLTRLRWARRGQAASLDPNMPAFTGHT